MMGSDVKPVPQRINGQSGQLSSTSRYNSGDTGGPRLIQMTLRLL